MPNLKAIANNSHSFLKENVIPIIGCALAGAFLGGMIVASSSYKVGYSAAMKDTLNLLIEKS